MKKTLVALAAIAATSAFAEAKISGFIDQAYNRTTTDGVTTVSIGNNAIGQDSINISLSEDLGNGLTAYGNIGIMPDVSAGSLAGDASGVGIKGAFGNVFMGKKYTEAWGVFAAADAVGFGSSKGLIHGPVGHGQIAMRNDTISYTLPTLVEGLSATIETSRGQSQADTSTYGAAAVLADANAGRGWSISYATGGLKVSTASITSKFAQDPGATGTPLFDGADTGSVTTVSVTAASYDFGLATAFYGTATSKNASVADAKFTSSNIGVSVPLGALTLAVASTSGTSTDGTTEAKSTGTRMIAKYALSKRTTAYLVNGNEKLGTYGTTDVVNSRQTGLGVIHNF